MKTIPSWCSPYPIPQKMSIWSLWEELGFLHDIVSMTIWNNFFVVVVEPLNLQYLIQRETTAKRNTRIISKTLFKFKLDKQKVLYQVWDNFWQLKVLKMMKNVFYFMSKAFLFSRYLRRLISNFTTLQASQQTIVIHILPNILRSKGNQTMKFDQLRKCNMKHFSLKNHKQNVVEKLVPDPFLKN